MGLRDLTWFDAVERSATLFSDRPALAFDDLRITHREALARAEALAAGLAAAGIGRGDRVAILAQNRPEHLDLLAAAARLGAILLPVNWRLGADEVAHVLTDGQPAIVVMEPEFAPLVSPLRRQLAATRWYALDGASIDGHADFAALLAPDAPLPAPVATETDGLLLIHTAAIGGKPRGALLTHRNLVAASTQLAGAWGLGPDDVALGLLPLFHITGLGLALAVQAAGGSSVVMRRFDPDRALDLVADERVTVSCEFAPMLGQMLDAAAARPRDLSSLRALWGLDAPAAIERFEAACPGARFWSGYGQSEVSGFVTLAPFRDCPGSAGRPLPLAVLDILDEDDRTVPVGTTGEIAIRGPLVFDGYWRLPEDNALTFRNGWHHTGDMGRRDGDGFLVYAGRSPAKELIKSGGENVYPSEVEAALRGHPAVEAAVVFGVPDERWGEAVRAVCQCRPGETVDADALIAFVGQRIARYKRPKEVVFVDALPRTESGGPDRAKVKAEHGGA